VTDIRERHHEVEQGICRCFKDADKCDALAFRREADAAEAALARLRGVTAAVEDERDAALARADKAEAERDELRGRLLLLGPPTEPLSYNQVKAAMERVEEVIARPHRERADAAEAALADLPEYITRWLMGEGMVVVGCWMTTGWRETMYDEGVAIWTAALAAHKEATE